MNTQEDFFNLIILDASGSVGSIYNQDLSGVNETLVTKYWQDLILASVKK